jgi:cell division protein FtsB
VKRLLIAAAIVAMAAFAFEGGEYGTLDLLSLRRQVRDQQAAIVRLRHEVDSLSKEARALRTDPATQERAAREQYGMLRPGELLYQLVPADSGGP